MFLLDTSAWLAHLFGEPGATKRLPTIDALIAATAVQNKAVLVHRDPHFEAIPIEQLQQLKLPEK